MTTIKLLILASKNFGLFLVIVTAELYFLFMIYLKNQILLPILELMGCGTTKKVVTK